MQNGRRRRRVRCLLLLRRRLSMVGCGGGGGCGRWRRRQISERFAERRGRPHVVGVQTCWGKKNSSREKFVSVKIKIYASFFFKFFFIRPSEWWSVYMCARPLFRDRAAACVRVCRRVLGPRMVVAWRRRWRLRQRIERRTVRMTVAKAAGAAQAAAAAAAAAGTRWSYSHTHPFIIPPRRRTGRRFAAPFRGRVQQQQQQRCVFRSFSSLSRHPLTRARAPIRPPHPKTYTTDIGTRDRE